MGDRANVVIIDQWRPDPPHVHLYTHWGGDELAADVSKAIARRQRWDDPTYLARIVFNAMGAGEDGETGFGIATAPPDNQHPLLYLDTAKQCARIGDGGPEFPFDAIASDPTLFIKAWVDA
jgi:hypothetical protein